MVYRNSGPRVLDDFAEQTADPPTDRRIGTVVGRYKLSAVLGRGGAGIVYLAERADEQYSARVAVKVLAHAGTHNLGQRFKLERQILASLNHPNIARLIDAGETDDGQPYLVMEFIEGAPVHRYSDERQLGVQQRLQLFMEICGAVQSAHQNLVVHRDLKPQNVLVTAEGTVKLLDFGIAKLLETGATTAALTRMNERALTAEYASPEQIRGDVITTATDVYSLGVMLYQLLTGVLPFPITPNASQVELERLVCLTDPPRPSSAVLKAMETEPGNILAIAAARNLTPERLSRALLGDIDAIILRALRKEAEHRYTSVERFSADLRRYLQSEPVEARQGNWVYYSQRFMRRHTATVAVGSTFVLGLIGVSIAMSVQAHRIAIERDRAEVVSEFMTNVFAASDPFVHRGKELTAGELLDTAAQKIAKDLQKDPEVRARLLEAIGRSFRRQALPARAIPYLEEAARIQRSLRRADERAASVLTELAIGYRDSGRFDDANRAFDEALAISRTLKQEDSKTHAQLLVDLGRLEAWRSNPQKAEAQYRAGLQMTRALEGPDSLEAAAILSELASIRLWMDDLAAAEKLAREAVAIYRERAPALDPDRVAADLSLGEILLYQGRHDAAAELLTSALDARRKLYAPDSARIAEVLGTLAQVRVAQRSHDEAERLLREAMGIAQRAPEQEQHNIVRTQTVLGRLLLDRGAVADAEHELREALTLSVTSFGANHQYTASCGHYLGEALLQLGRVQEAAEVLQVAALQWQRSGAPAWRTARARNSLAEAMFRLGQVDAARQLLVTSYRALETDPQAEREAIEQARQRLMRFYPEYRISN